LQLIAPGIGSLVQSAARGHLPFGFGRQPRAGPFAVSLSVVPGDVDDGVIEAVEDAARRSLQLRPIGTQHRDPPWRFLNACRTRGVRLLRQQALEDKTPAVAF